MSEIRDPFPPLSPFFRLFACARRNSVSELGKAQRNFAESLRQFKFDVIGTNQTDEEKVIAGCFVEFSRFIEQFEDQREQMLIQSEDRVITAMKKFRTDCIQQALNVSVYCLSSWRYNFSKKISRCKKNKNFQEQSSWHVLKIRIP